MSELRSALQSPPQIIVFHWWQRPTASLRKMIAVQILRGPLSSYVGIFRPPFTINQIGKIISLPAGPGHIQLILLIDLELVSVNWAGRESILSVSALSIMRTFQIRLALASRL